MTAITVTDLDNAKLDVDHIAEIANSMDITATDRMGHAKDTISGAVYKITAFTDRGAWAPATAYAVKDLVSNGGSWYVAVVAHTSSAAFATDTASKWRLYQGVTTGDLSASTGSRMVGHQNQYSPTESAPYLKTVSDMLSGQTVSSDRFVDSTKLTAIRDFTSTYNAAPDLQKAITACMYESNSGDLYIANGRYRTDDALHIGYGTSFKQLNLRGAGSTYRGAVQFNGTLIEPTFSDRPAIAVQGGRRVRISSLALLGLNYSHILSAGLGNYDCTVDDTNISTWISGSLHANANSRYAPYAGIAVDPYCGMAPSPAYPNVTFPAVVGTPAQYGKAATDTCVIDDCYISGFVVGAAIKPSDADGNGDFVSFRDTVFEFLPYGVSVGNSQSRQVNLNNCDLRNIHTCLTNTKHGKQIGKFGGHYSGLGIGRIIKLLDISVSYSGPMVFDGAYGELIWSLGKIIRATRNPAISFIGCELNFVDHPAIRGAAPGLFDVTQAPVIFNGGSLLLPSITSAGCDISFNDTYVDALDCTNVSPSEERKLSQRVSAGILPVGTNISVNNSTSMLISPTATIQERLGETHIPFGRSAPFSRINRYAQALGQIPHAEMSIIEKSSATASFSGISGTIDFTASPYNFQYEIRAGDLISDDETGTVFFIDSVAGLVASVTAKNNYYNPGSGNVFRTSVSFSTGNWYIVNSRVYGATYPIYATATAGSAVLTAVARGDGYGGFTSSSLAVNDFVYQGVEAKAYFPFGAKISSIDTGAGTITMSANAIASVTQGLFNFWVRG